MLNLLSNAVKFVPRDDGRVNLRLLDDDTGLTVEVRDNGPGVPVEQHGAVFEKFRQGGESAGRPPGTGLGLTISRRIVEHLGGRIWLAAAPVGGACFSFWLPWQPKFEDPPDGGTLVRTVQLVR